MTMDAASYPAARTLSDCIEMSCPFVPIGVDGCCEGELTGRLEVSVELHPTSTKVHNANEENLLNNYNPMKFYTAYK